MNKGLEREMYKMCLRVICKINGLSRILYLWGYIERSFRNEC